MSCGEARQFLHGRTRSSQRQTDQRASDELCKYMIIYIFIYDFSPISRSMSASKSSNRPYSMMTLPRPLWSSIVTLKPRALCSCSCASRTLGSTAFSAFGSFLAFAAWVDKALHVALGLPHRHGKCGNALRSLFHLLGVFQRKQGASVAETRAHRPRRAFARHLVTSIDARN